MSSTALHSLEQVLNQAFPKMQFRIKSQPCNDGISVILTLYAVIDREYNTVNNFVGELEGAEYDDIANISVERSHIRLEQNFK